MTSKFEDTLRHSERVWHYVRNGVRNGPVGFAELSHLLLTGGLKADDLVWTPGMAQWRFAHEVEGLCPRVKPGLDVGPARGASDVTAPPQPSGENVIGGSSGPLNTPVSSNTNYFARHWRGELSLGVSYWVNGALIAGALSSVLSVVVGEMDKDANSLRAISLAAIGAVVFALASWLWSVVGIWRSADLHPQRGGRAGWANAAKVMVVLGALAMSSNLATLVPGMLETGMIAFGLDPMGKVDVKVAGDGRSVVVQGFFREGAADEIQKILDAAPSAKILVFNSPGGRLIEAQKLARIVTARKLDTYVEDHCASACTYAFLAGRDRAATPNAKIGFHQPSFPGWDLSTQQSAIQEMKGVYQRAGLPEQFIEHITNISQKDMWYPTRDELIEAKVITRISLGGEASLLGLSAMRSKQELLLALRSEALFEALERRFPGKLASAVDRGWAAKEAGANDANVMTAMRSVVAEVWPVLTKAMDDAMLDRFGRVVFKQLSAARAVSVEACNKYLASELNVALTLPKEVVQEEQDLLIEALNAPSRRLRAAPAKREMEEAIRTLASKMPANLVPVIADPRAFASQPQLVCDATIAFYRAIQGLPERAKIVALRGLFQAEN